MTKGTSGHPFVIRTLVLVLSLFATACILCVFPLMEALTPSPNQVKQPKPIPIQIKYLEKHAPSVQPSESTVQDVRTTSKPADAVSLPAPIAAPPSTPLVDFPHEELVTEPLATKVPMTEPTATEPTAIEPLATEPLATRVSANEASESNIPSNTTTNDDEKGSNQPTATMTGTDIPAGDSLKHPPRPMKRVQPRYPERARRLSIEGYVVLRFIIDAKGFVTAPTIHQSIPAGVFDNAAIRAVRQWRFEPGKGDDGKPVPSQLQLRIDFKLENSR